MGACNDQVTFDGTLTEKELQKRVQAYMDECERESGASYSGRLNMCSGLTITSHIFEGRSEAKDYIFGAGTERGKAEKWGPAVACQYRIDNSYKQTKPMEKLNAVISQLMKQEHELRFQAEQRTLQKLKSVEFIVCGTCKSRMDTRFATRTIDCPVCGAEFTAKKELQKLAMLAQKLTAAKARLELLRKKAQAMANKKPCKTAWLVGGICSS